MGKSSQLFVLDALGLGVAFYGSQAIRFHSWAAPSAEVIFTIAIFGAINIFCLYLMNLYQIEPQDPFWRKPIQTLSAAFFAGCIIVILSYFSGVIAFSGLIGRGVLIGAQTAFALWASSTRLIYSKWIRKESLRSMWLVVGTGSTIRPFIEDLRKSNLAGTFTFLTHPSEGLTQDLLLSSQAGVPSNVRHLSPYSAELSGGALSFKLGGTWNDLRALSKNRWSGVIVAMGSSMPDDLTETLMHIRLSGIRIHDLASFYEEAWYKIPVFYLERSWFAMSQGFHLLHNPVGLRAKRVLDVLGALFLLLVTSPVLLLTALAIKLESRGPILFSQVRVGENDKPFTVYKLRSMRLDAEKDGAQWAKEKDSRITRVGDWIRKTRIDELPQLWNVIRGDMSFIGPRPERPEFTDMLEKEIPFYGLRHVLKPGVTGWAQVMYPYGASVEDAREKLHYDLYYIKNYSLSLDAAITIKTIRVVLFGKGR